jgi:hypothetical protein
MRSLFTGGPDLPFVMRLSLNILHCLLSAQTRHPSAHGYRLPGGAGLPD